MPRDFDVINLHNEEKYVSFLMHTFPATEPLDYNLLLNKPLQILCIAICDIQEAKISFSIDELYHFAHTRYPETDKEYIQKIYDSFSDFENMDFIFRAIKENHIKNKINLQLLEAIYEDVAPNGELNEARLIQLADSIKENISEMHGEIRLMTAKDMAIKYARTLKRRDEGLKSRDLGYRILKERSPIQAEEGEMTLLFGPSGQGKTAVAQNMQFGLLNRGIPVIKFGTEMTVDSEMDRSMAMRLNISTFELYKSNRDIRFNSHVDRTLQAFSTVKNYLHVDESNLSLNDVDILVGKAREHFRREGVFKDKDDEYFVAIYDLASMVKEVAGEYGEGVEKGANEFHIMTQKYGIHSLLVVQANENKFRAGLRFKNPEEIDHHVFVDEDIKGGAGWKERCRLVLSVYRPLMLKKKYFPNRMAEWELEEDILWLSAIKNNSGPLFRVPFIFDVDSFRIVHLVQQPVIPAIEVPT